MRALLPATAVAFVLLSISASAQNVAFCQAAAGGGPGYAMRVPTAATAEVYRKYEECMKNPQKFAAPGSIPSQASAPSVKKPRRN